MRRRGSKRVLATVLFTDIVGSTERASELGDRAWRELLRSHHRAMRRALRRHSGREIDTAGDGFFATFTQPAEAIACAIEAADALEDLGIVIRAGIHSGEVEPIGAKVGGIAVHIGARVLAASEPGTIVVSSTVRDLASGGGYHFVDLGARQLKGVAEEWRLYRVDRPPRLATPTEEPAKSRAWPTRRLVVMGAGVVAVAAVAGGATFLIARGPGATSEDATGPNVVRAIEADGEMTTGFAVGQGPGAVVATSEALWVANTDGGTVSRVDRSAGQNAVVGAGVPTDIGASAGFIWVLDPFDSILSVISPDDARIVATIDVHGRAMAATDDAIWLADDLTDAVHRIDPRTRSVAATIPMPAGSGPSAIAADDDNVWVVHGLTGTIARIDAGTDRVTMEVLALAEPATSVAIGDDAVWVAAEGADLVIQVDPASNRVVEQRDVCDRPLDVAAAGTTAWIACADQRVWRIDAGADEPVITNMDGVPGGLAVDADRVWATVRES